VSFRKECFIDHCNVSCECGLSNWKITTENSKKGDIFCCNQCQSCFTIGDIGN